MSALCRAVRITLLLFAVTVASSIPIAAQDPFVVHVVSVADGDTISVIVDGHRQRVRLYGIDCPEKDQPFGQAATRYTAEAISGGEVTLTTHGADRYGRIVADVTLMDGRVLNRELVKAGMAWWYRKYARREPELQALEEAAHAARIGLWASESPIPPWTWRADAKAGHKWAPLEKSTPSPEFRWASPICQNALHLDSLELVDRRQFASPRVATKSLPYNGSRLVASTNSPYYAHATGTAWRSESLILTSGCRPS